MFNRPINEVLSKLSRSSIFSLKRLSHKVRKVISE
ncbi:MAG: hypothetical protein KJO81_02560 [Gammaproteobacteria bacterium]|nr:hypothetical protein [Gammaproteobacteria bacterium]